MQTVTAVYTCEGIWILTCRIVAGITERVAFTITDFLVYEGWSDGLFRQVECHDTVTACCGRQCNHMVTTFGQVGKVLVTVNAAGT